MGYAGEREEMIAAGVKKLLDRTRALNKVTYTRTLYCPLSTPIVLQNLMLRASMGFFVNGSTPCDCINWDSKKRLIPILLAAHLTSSPERELFRI